MNNNIINQQTWWKRNWKWFTPLCGLILISVISFFMAGIDGITTNLVQAYTDTNLYEKALDTVKTNAQVIEILGEINPIDKLAILEGQVEYENNNKTVHSSIRITGTKGKANMDIIANKFDSIWHYKKIIIRIKSPKKMKQTIEVVTEN